MKVCEVNAPRILEIKKGIKHIFGSTLKIQYIIFNYFSITSISSFNFDLEPPIRVSTVSSNIW